MSTKWSKEEKKLIRGYNKAVKKYKKNLIKIIKKDETTFDYTPILDIMEKMIDIRLEYFTTYEELTACGDITPIHNTLSKAFYKLNKIISLEKASSSSNTMELLYGEDLIAWGDEELQKLYIDFFKYVGEHIREWWD